MFPWYVYAILGSFLWSIGLVVEKKVLSKEHSFEYCISRMFFSSMILLLFIPYIKILSNTVLAYTYIASLLTTVAIIYRVKAFRHMEISLVAPFMNLDPMFVLIVSFIILQEKITSIQIAGIFIMIFGAYALEADGNIRNLKKPLKKIKESKYLHFILLSLTIYSLAAVTQKHVLSQTSEVLSFLFYFWIMVFINFLIISIIKYDGLNQIKKGVRKQGFWIFLIAIFLLSSSYFLFSAIALGSVTLVIAIKRLGTVFTTFLGGEYFHEKDLKLRLISSLIILTGAYLILI